MDIERAWEEKRVAYSRENEDIICDHCDNHPDECGYHYLFCEQCAKEAADELKEMARNDI